MRVPAGLFIVCIAVVLAVGFASEKARASGPVEQVVQVAFHPSDPDVIVLRYVNKGAGLFYSHDRGETWSMVCGAFAASELRAGVDDAGFVDFDMTVLAIAGDGTVLGGSFNYLWVGDTVGCEWRNQPESLALAIRRRTRAHAPAKGIG